MKLFRNLFKRDPKLEDCIEGYLLYARVDRQVSARTLKWYRIKLTKYQEWAREEQPGDGLTRDAFRLFILYLMDEEFAKATIAGYVRTLRQFGKWLLETGRLDHNPARTLKQPKLGDKPPKGISRADIRKILAAVQDHPRNYAIICFLRDTGVRAGELLGLEWSDVNLEERTATVVGKGQKYRVVPFSKRTAEALRAYRESELQQHRIFPLQYWGLRSLLNRLADQAETEGPVNAHAWRHAFGRDMSARGCPTTTLQRLLGHSTPQVTQIYVQYRTKELVDAYDNYSDALL